VPIDYEQLRAERIRVAEQNRESDWSLREKAIVDRDRAELAKQREAEQHRSEVNAFSAFALDQAQAARKAGHADNAETWDDAIVTIGRGLWPVSRVVMSHPAIGRFQGLRTRLNYAGKNRRIG
jgi:hypothetical protein